MQLSQTPPPTLGKGVWYYNVVLGVDN